MFDEMKFPQIHAALTRMYDEPNSLRDIYEFGTYNGASLVKTYNKLVKYGIPFDNIFAIDSFDGLPKENGEVFEKFTQGSYKASKNPTEIKKLINYKKLHVIKRWYDQLTDWDAYYYDMKPAKLIHIDCDLYSSTKQALEFMFRNKLIVPGTLLAYDEFLVEGQKKCEYHAHWECLNISDLFFKTIWFFTYNDKNTQKEITQYLYEVVK